MNGKYSIGEYVLGSWRLEKLIGEGSYGKVYEAVREELGETYYSAIKVITIPQSQSEISSVRAEGMDNKSITDYFGSLAQDVVKEFAIMSKLRGTANVVSYEDHAIIRHEDQIGWDIIIRMELLTPLTSYMMTHPMDEESTVRLGIDMCKALELCRERRIIHRDIKPQNIFVSKYGDYKLGDFGIARTVERTMGGLSKKGTYNYMAPEVYRGEPYNASVDIYSLGIVLYGFLNNNRVPFLPDYPQKVTYSDREKALDRRMKGEVFPTPKNASPELAEIVLKACAYNPKERFSSPAEMKHALQSFIGEAIEETPVEKPEDDIYDDSTVAEVSEKKSIIQPESTIHVEKEDKGKKRIEKEETGKNPLAAAAAFIVLIALLAGGWMIFKKGKTTPPAETPTVIAAEITAEPSAEPTPEPTPESTPKPTPEPTPEPSPTPKHVYKNTSGLVDSGSCGESTIWELYEDGTLYIGGSGAMDNYTFDSETQEYTHPWNKYHSSIKELAVESGVSFLGDCAFSDCINLSSATLPDSVSGIGAAAFENTPFLENNRNEFVVVGNGILIEYRGVSTAVKIPDGVEYISDAFRDCQSVKSIQISTSTKGIGSHAFSNCVILSSVTIPDSVKSIGASAFSDCQSLRNVYFSGTRARWGKIDIDSEAWIGSSATILCGDGNYQVDDGVMETPIRSCTSPTGMPGQLAGGFKGNYYRYGAEIYELDNSVNCRQVDLHVKLLEYSGNPFRTWSLVARNTYGEWVTVGSFLLSEEPKDEYQTFTIEFSQRVTATAFSFIRTGSNLVTLNVFDAYYSNAA